MRNSPQFGFSVRGPLPGFPSPDCDIQEYPLAPKGAAKQIIEVRRQVSEFVWPYEETHDYLHRQLRHQLGMELMEFLELNKRLFSVQIVQGQQANNDREIDSPFTVPTITFFVKAIVALVDWREAQVGEIAVVREDLFSPEAIYEGWQFDTITLHGQKYCLRRA